MPRRKTPAMPVGLYTVKRYVVESFEVEVLDGESLSLKEIGDRAINPYSVVIRREEVLTKRTLADAEEKG